MACAKLTEGVLFYVYSSNCCQYFIGYLKAKTCVLSFLLTTITFSLSVPNEAMTWFRVQFLIIDLLYWGLTLSCIMLKYGETYFKNLAVRHHFLTLRMIEFKLCSMVKLSQFPADLVTFTEEILNGKLHFLFRE